MRAAASQPILRFYETKEPTETHRLLKEEIMARIDHWHTELSAMGSRKIAAKLRDEGYMVGRKLVRSYIREFDFSLNYSRYRLVIASTPEKH